MRLLIHLLLCFICCTQILLGQIKPSVDKMSWDDLISIVDEYQQKGWYAKSLPYALRMRELATDRYAKKGTRYAMILRKTVQASEAVEDWMLSQTIRKELVAISALLYGKKSVDYAEALVHLAKVKMKLGQYKESENLCWQVKNIKLQNPLNQQYYPVQFFNRSIDQIRDKGQRKRAYRVYFEVKIIFIHSLITLSSNYLARGEHQAYELTNESALEETAKLIRYVLNSAGGVISDEVITNLERLFYIFDDCESYKKGEQLYLTTIDLARGSDLYLPLALNLATIYTRIGEYTGARLMYTKLLQRAEEKYGTESLPFAAALADLANFYILLEDSSEAAKLYLKAKGIVLRLQGRESELYLDLNKKLKNVYRFSQQRNE
ncbi:tetratricopeptide repeat protein [Aureispira anguillae]|uniref:Tetratricopeptide repeat protein n=1 Tax=Aureispira anguillae TaxID=2864201 RepID=A0A915YLP9_9BACT|nr:tetratricopeptide repeat protein [Aureispira anguillae]BDS15319.1 tetratricopeptide repeat protein [Aureispira anguillae]